MIVFAVFFVDAVDSSIQGTKGHVLFLFLLQYTYSVFFPCPLSFMIHSPWQWFKTRTAAGCLQLSCWWSFGCYKLEHSIQYMVYSSETVRASMSTLYTQRPKEQSSSARIQAHFPSQHTTFLFLSPPYECCDRLLDKTTSELEFKPTLCVLCTSCFSHRIHFPARGSTRKSHA